MSAINLTLDEVSAYYAKRAYSERCRSAFRGDGDRDSEVMPITIPRGWRSLFRREADQFSADLGMMIAIVGIVL